MQYLSTLFVLCFLSFGTHSLFAQAGNCFDSYLSPFCSGIAQYPANFDGTGAGSGPQAPAGPNYDCLGTQGNPTYFSLTIEQTGSINFTLDNTANVDIDFILWGPFNSIGAAQMACDSIGQGGQWGDVDTCSYSGITAEPVSISNAVAGEVYILMVTNFANVATNIFSTQNTGTGSIACPCDIPYTVDTMSTANGNQGFLVDTTNGLNQYLVCPNMTVGIQLEAKSALNDTLSLYGPFTTVNSVFNNNSVFAFNPNAPTSFDSLTVFTLITPDNNNIGVNDFSMGLQNDLYTGGLTDSTCFDLLNFQVIVPGVQVSDRMVCSGDNFQVHVDSIPTTALGSSSYSWSQISGPTVTFSSTTVRQPMISIPITASNSSNDSTIIVVDYNYGGLCPMSDTMILRYPDQGISANATPDTTCVGLPATLMVNLQDTLNPAICDDYDVVLIPNNPLPGTGTLVNTFTATSTFSSTDEGISVALPVGFDFDFYCNTYNQFYIHTNGFITFDPIVGTPGLLSGASMPTAGVPENLIALSWEDLDVANGGTIRYYVQGTAPNRQLVVSFNAIQNWLGGTSMTSQAILYEADNSIEIHITNNDFNVSSIGIENGNGTLAHFHASLTQGQALAPFSNTAYRFTPKTFGPFYTWSPPATLSAPDVYNPSATLQTAGTTNYSVQVQDGACTYATTTNLTAIPSLNTPQLNCDSSSTSTLSFSWSDIGLPTGGFYEISLDSGQTWMNVGNSLDTTIAGLVADTAYYLMVRGNDGTGGPCAMGPAAMGNCSTLNPDCTVNPLINTLLIPTNLACNNDNSGCIHASVTGGSGNPMNFTWSNGAMDVDSICSLGAGTYTLVVTDTFSQGSGPPIQTTAYQETFDGVHNWTLNVSTGVNGADNNFWETDSDEAGMPVGACGSSGGPNRSLHITSVFNPSGGAAYDAGGLCPILFCPETNMRAESPTFSTVGLTNLTLEFNYISFGHGGLDNASVWYNDGTGWQVLDPSIKSTTCGSGQGLWEKFTMTLPASCNNQASVQVGINWTNNDDGIGSDPSVAVDSIHVFQLSGGASLITCVDSQSITITEPPVLITAVDSTTNPFCSGTGDGAVSISTIGGTPNYAFNWSNGATTEDITGVNDGTYTVTVTDNNGCSDTTQAVLTVPNPIVINLDNSNNNSCEGSPDGSIFISVLGGTGPVSYLWNNGATTEDVTGIANNTYVVTVTDQNNCSDTATVTIIPTILLVSIDTTIQPLCHGDNASSAITVGGGTGSYTFDWGTASTSTTSTALLNGTQTVAVTITDSGNGCTVVDSIDIIEPATLSVSLNSTTNIGCTDPPNSGAIDINSTGGTIASAYNFNWDNGSTTEDILGLGAGNYTVTVLDDNGCSDVLNATITASAGITVSINTLIGQLACDLAPIGALEANATGGTGINYTWNTGNNTATVGALGAGNFVVTATNSDGCTATTSATINAPAIPSINPYVSVVGLTNVTVPSNTNVTIDAGGSGYNYNWVGFANPSTGNPTIANDLAENTTASPDPEGTYTYIVTASVTTNDTTCTATDTVWITVEAPFKGIPTAFTPNGDGANDYFAPVTLSDAEVNTFRVYNRWGQEVYNGDEAHGLGWDGTFNDVEQPTEVYLYLIIYKKASDLETTTIRGEVTLIR